MFKLPITDEIAQRDTTVLLDDSLRWEAVISKDRPEDAYSELNNGIPIETFKRFGLDDDLVNQIKQDLPKIWSRLKGHILRLCNPSRTIAENAFGLAIVLYGDTGLGGERVKLPQCAEGEDLATPWWWSVSPYIMYELMIRDYQPSDVLESICSWGEKVKGSNTPLPGIEDEFKYFGEASLVLSDKPDHVSHIYARKLAVKVIGVSEDFLRFKES